VINEVSTYGGIGGVLKVLSLLILSWTLIYPLSDYVGSVVIPALKDGLLTNDELSTISKELLKLLDVSKLGLDMNEWLRSYWFLMFLTALILWLIGNSLLLRSIYIALRVLRAWARSLFIIHPLLTLALATVLLLYVVDLHVIFTSGVKDCLKLGLEALNSTCMLFWRVTLIVTLGWLTEFLSFTLLPMSAGAKEVVIGAGKISIYAALIAGVLRVGEFVYGLAFLTKEVPVIKEGVMDLYKGALYVSEFLEFAKVMIAMSIAATALISITCLSLKIRGVTTGALYRDEYSRVKAVSLYILSRLPTLNHIRVWGCGCYYGNNKPDNRD